MRFRDARGLADAFLIGADFIGKRQRCPLFWATIFSMDRKLFPECCVRQRSGEKGATIFGYFVRDPREYGVVEFDENGKALSIEESRSIPRATTQFPDRIFMITTLWKSPAT